MSVTKTIDSDGNMVPLWQPTETDLVGDIRGGNGDVQMINNFTVALQSLMMQHQITKVDVAWAITPWRKAEALQRQYDFTVQMPAPKDT